MCTENQANCSDSNALPVFQLHQWAWIVGGVFSFTSCVLSIILIYAHLKWNHMDHLRKYIIRILLMVPLYAVEAWLGLYSPGERPYWDVARGCYEAFVVYSFYTFLVQYLGGSPKLVEDLKYREADAHKVKAEESKLTWLQRVKKCCKPSEEDPHEHRAGDLTHAELDALHATGANVDAKKDDALVVPVAASSPIVAQTSSDASINADAPPEAITMDFPPAEEQARHRDPHAGEQYHLFPVSLCYWWPIQPRYFIWSTQWGALQYVPVQVICSILTFILQLTGNYHDGNVAFNDGYPYIALVINFSQIWAVYCLFWFYHSFQRELKPIRPLPKALCIKGVVFLTFWQSVFISLLVKYNALHATENFSVEDIATGLQDFLVCLEMFIAAVAHNKFFGVSEWEDKMVNPDGRVVPKPQEEIPDDGKKHHGPKGPVLQRMISFLKPNDIVKDLKDVMIKPGPKNRASIDATQVDSQRPPSPGGSADAEAASPSTEMGAAPSNSSQETTRPISNSTLANASDLE